MCASHVTNAAVNPLNHDLVMQMCTFSLTLSCYSSVPPQLLISRFLINICCMNERQHMQSQYLLGSRFHAVLWGFKNKEVTNLLQKILDKIRANGCLIWGWHVWWLQESSGVESRIFFLKSENLKNGAQWHLQKYNIEVVRKPVRTNLGEEGSYIPI